MVKLAASILFQWSVNDNFLLRMFASASAIFGNEREEKFDEFRRTESALFKR